MQSFLADRVQTVSQITSEIKLMLEGNYRFVAVSGEISNLRIPFSGHHYFTLKDSDSQLRAVLFKGQQRYLLEPLKDGQQVVCRGRISVYAPRGDYQLIVDTVDQHGAGALQRKFEELKKQLAEEGLFEQELKREIPPFPMKIVVISSPTGAAIHDFLKICRQRNTAATIQIFPTAVQGESAAQEMAAAIATANSQLDCDLIVLCRGGGSIEDLWAFNEEVLARAIYASETPIVSGVGHEIDFTIADFCADLRAPTPTGAAEMVIPDANRLKEELDARIRTLARLVTQKIDIADGEVRHFSRLLRGFQGRQETSSLRLDLEVERFQRAALSSIGRQEEHLRATIHRLERQAPLTRLAMKSQDVIHLRRQLVQQMLSHLKRDENRLARGAALLQGVSPLSTLARGYAIVQAKDRASTDLVSVTSSAQVDIEEMIQILLHEGQLQCRVINKS